jgi:hypothetical protein
LLAYKSLRSTSEADVKAGLEEANVPPETADEIVKANEKAQIDGSRAAEAILALLALIALPFTPSHPDRPTRCQSQAQIIPRMTDSSPSRYGSGGQPWSRGKGDAP